MYVIIQNGVHQYRVEPGQFLKMEKIQLSEGESWKCGQVLAFQDKAGELVIGNPYVEKAEVHGRVVRHGKSKKILVFKKNRRKGYRRTQGHRQEFTEIYIEAFNTPNGKKIKADKKQGQKKVLSGPSQSVKSVANKNSASIVTKENGKKRSRALQ